jgi:DNA-directed RNA polymerase sigma subunit (sigma70/sigma32)
MTKKTEPIPFMGLVEVDDDVYPMTQQEVADKIGITRNAVGDTERRALKKFKEKFLSKFKKDDFI